MYSFLQYVIIPPFVMEGKLLQECILNNGLNIRIETVVVFLLSF